MSPALASFDFGVAPCRMRFGRGRLREISDIVAERSARKVAWIVDSYLASDQHNEWLRAAGSEAASGCDIFAMPPGEPDTDTVEQCHAFIQDTGAELLVALGGGSTMDTAKVARLMLANGHSIQAIADAKGQIARPELPFVCVPTTAGTGSEVSEMAVISRRGSSIKIRVRSRDAVPDIAILDPDLLLTLPPQPTAYTGFDAFTHAFEAFTSRKASAITDLLTRAALEKLWHWLPVAFAEPGNVAARGECLLASALAGIAFNSTELGLAHAISAPLGAQHHVIHGLGNALALPAVTAFNEPTIEPAKRDWMLSLMGTETVADGVRHLREQVRLDLGLEDCLPPDADYQVIAEAAMKSGNIPTNPRQPTLPAVKAILEAMREPLHRAPPVFRDDAF